MIVKVSGLHILTGKPGEPCHCAIAKALNVAGYLFPSVDQLEIGFAPLVGGGEVTRPAPAAVGEFVRRFDGGEQLQPIEFEFPWCNWCGESTAAGPHVHGMARAIDEFSQPEESCAS